MFLIVLSGIVSLQWATSCCLCVYIAVVCVFIFLFFQQVSVETSGNRRDMAKVKMISFLCGVQQGLLSSGS